MPPFCATEPELACIVGFARGVDEAGHCRAIKRGRDAVRLNSGPAKFGERKRFP
jgi:predicted Rossmann fold nucleotide-binding protein DprA/Smf involved in DNA uptake